MTQNDWKNDVLRSGYAQQAVIRAVSATEADAARAQAEQLSRKLAAARTEVRRYQTRLFAVERQIIALRRENLDLETALEKSEQALLVAEERARQAEAALAECVTAVQEQPAEELPAPQPEEPEPLQAEPPLAEEPAAEPAQAQSPEPVWQPKTDAERLAVSLIAWFDAAMP